MSLEPLDTAEGAEFSGCLQLAIFLENRLGQLMRLTRLLDTEDIHILSLSVESSVDCAIVRVIVNKPELARQMIAGAGFAVTETELLIVELPAGKRGLMAVCAALISAEVNINYAYPLMKLPNRGACVAIQVDHLPEAAQVLSAKNFTILSMSDL